jgi:ribosomal protein L4
MKTWRHRDMEKEKWGRRHGERGHGDMETWRHKDTNTQRHGGMETWGLGEAWRHGGVETCRRGTWYRT